MPENAPQPKKSGSRMLIIAIILCVIALAALAVILVFVVIKPFDTANAPQAPQISEVEQAFNSTEIDPPSLSGYMYIKTDDLSNPKISQYSVGSVTEDPSAKGSFTCEGRAEAEFENDYIKAVVPLTVKMTQAADATSWVAGGVEKGKANVTPTGPADLDAIQANLQNILKSYNQDLANQFVGCEVRPEASLNAQGGTIVFNLSKTEGDQTRTCAVNADVTWGDSGWNVKVTSVSGLEEPTETPAENQEPATEPTPDDSASNPPSGSSSGNSGSSELRPTMLLECWSGDLVRVPGTIQIEQNGAVLLRTDDVILVRFNNRDYITTYFEITGSGTWQNGQHIILDGAISATGSNPIAPLVINTNYS